MTDLIHGLQQQNKKMSEMHIAFVLKEVIKVCIQYTSRYFLFLIIKKHVEILLYRMYCVLYRWFV